MGFKVAIAGATGNVGREMLNILEERSFPADEVVPLASRRSLGSDVSYGDRTLKVQVLDHYDFSGTDICLSSTSGKNGTNSAGFRWYLPSGLGVMLIPTSPSFLNLPTLMAKSTLQRLYCQNVRNAISGRASLMSTSTPSYSTSSRTTSSVA